MREINLYGGKVNDEGTYFEEEVGSIKKGAGERRVEALKVNDPVYLELEYTPDAIAVYNMNSELLGYFGSMDTDALCLLLKEDIEYESAKVVTIIPLAERSKRAKKPLLVIGVTLSE